MILVSVNSVTKQSVHFDVQVKVDRLTNFSLYLQLAVRLDRIELKRALR